MCAYKLVHRSSDRRNRSLELQRLPSLPLRQPHLTIYPLQMQVPPSSRLLRRRTSRQGRGHHPNGLRSGNLQLLPASETCLVLQFLTLTPSIIFRKLRHASDLVRRR